MIRKIYNSLLSLMVILLVLNLFISSAYAWYGPYYTPNGEDGDVHYRDTKKWAVQAGMSSFWASQVADNNAKVDVLFKKSLKWHLDRSAFTGDTEDTRIKQSRNEFTIAKRKIDDAAKHKKMMDGAGHHTI